MCLLKLDSLRQKHKQTQRRELKAVRKCVSICKVIFLQWKTDTDILMIAQFYSNSGKQTLRIFQD